MIQKILLCSFVFLLSIASGYAQRYQSLSGKVVDKESQAPLVGSVVTITDLSPIKGAVTDEQGQFFLDSIPLGKHQVVVAYMGYESATVADVLFTSAKQVVLSISLQETVHEMHEVVVKQQRDHINEMALVSTKTFDVQETERYAGSRSDPARMASNFAGAQGGNDARNDIVIRGNSPQGVLWRMEGLDIPNPNHFSIPGTSGGPVSMLNSKTLANSDFFSGAFPAEYGGAIAGVFDLKLRNGNKTQHEFTAQLGLLGTELAAEGPISKKAGSSYLVTYRYSTLQLFESFNFTIGTGSVPKYQDASVKLNFPIGKQGQLSFYALAGKSSIDLIVSKFTKPEPELYGESDRDQYFTSNTGISGLQYVHHISPKVYLQASVGLSGNDIYAHHEKVFRDSLFRLDSLKNILGFDFKTTMVTTHWLLHKKIDAKHSWRIGLINNTYLVNNVDSSRQYPTTRQDWQHRTNYKGNTSLLQAYAQYKWNIAPTWTINGGLHMQYLTHNGSFSFEPRLGARWLASERDVVTAGYGLHSQMQPLYQYFSHLPTSTTLHNEEVGFTRSHHLVLAYERKVNKQTKLRAETYLQYLFDVPVEARVGSSYSALNQGSSFSRDFPGVLQNTGLGYNYGAELTLERKLKGGYYLLLTGSLFDSKAKANDGIWRNTDFNTNYAANILVGTERKLGKYSTLVIGGKLTTVGGRLYSPVDLQASIAYGDAVLIDSLRNSQRLPAYFRADLKLGARFNGKSLTHEIAFDFVNLFNTKNVLAKTYSADLALQGKEPFFTQYQLGFLPIFYYRVDFGFAKKQQP